MRFVVRNTPGIHEVPIANMQIASVSSNDVVQVVDFSAMIENNLVSSAMKMTGYPLGTEGENGYFLDAISNFGSIELTDEYHYDFRTGVSRPLWYAAYAGYVYYNTRYLDKSLRRVIRTPEIDRVVTALIPSDGSYCLIRNSVSIEQTSGSSTGFLSRNDYYVNYATGTVYILSSAVAEDDVFIVRYRLVPDDISVSSETPSFYRSELSPASYSLCESCSGTGCSSCHGFGYIPGTDYYRLVILLSEPGQVTITYKTPETGETIDVREESANAVTLYTATSDEDRVTAITTMSEDPLTDEVIRRTFSLVHFESADRIGTTTSNPDTAFSFRTALSRTTKIRIEPPQGTGFSHDWYPTITYGTVVNDSETLEVSSTFASERISVSETATIVDQYTISLSHGNISAWLTADRGWAGISLTDEYGTELSISHVDTLHGIISVSNTVSRNSTIRAEYRVQSQGLQVTDWCLNPLSNHAYHNNGIVESVFLYVLGSTDSTVYLKRLPRYIDNRYAVYTYDTIETSLNAADPVTRNAYRADIPGLPSEYSDEELIRLEPLAIVYLVNPFDESAYTIEDIRIFGGGIVSATPSFYDHSFFDGEAFDAETMVKVHVPDSILTDLAQRALLWDRATLQSEDSDSYSKTAAYERVKRVVSKYTQLGCNLEIISG